MRQEVFYEARGGAEAKHFQESEPEEDQEYRKPRQRHRYSLEKVYELNIDFGDVHVRIINKSYHKVNVIKPYGLDSIKRSYIIQVFKRILELLMEQKDYKKLKLTDELVRKARMLELAGDPTRIRILCFMFRYKKACVTDIAESLEMSIASISHHLQIMKDNGYFTTERMGVNICYILVESDFIAKLEKIICGK